MPRAIQHYRVTVVTSVGANTTKRRRSFVAGTTEAHRAVTAALELSSLRSVRIDPITKRAYDLGTKRKSRARR